MACGLLQALWLLFCTSLALTSSDGNSTPSQRHHGLKRSVSERLDWNDTEAEEAAVAESKNAKIPVKHVKPHEELHLKCHLPQSELDLLEYGVKWFHNGLQVDSVGIDASNSGSHRYHVDPRSGQLHISSVRLEDDGVWQCMQFGQRLQIIVLDKPRSPYLLVDGRRLDPGNLFLPVKESLELSVTCVVEGGNPSPSIKWVLALSSSLDPALVLEDAVNVALNVSGTTHGDNHVYSHVQTRSEARLASVQRAHHNATVLCLVHHVTLPAPMNTSLLLDVQYSPSFAISREPGFGFPLREGIPVSLKCDVDSNPPSSPVWVKDDGSPPVTQSVDGFLNFTSIKREHSGWYKCTSRHSTGDFSSIGYFLNVRNDISMNMSQDPRLESYPTGRQVQVPLGGAVQLQCPEEAMGCWSRVGTNGRLEPVGPGPGLLISNIIYQDAGEYRCVSSKRGDLDRWRSEVNVDVTVMGRPSVHPIELTVDAYTGQSVRVSLEFCANPPATKAFWVTETQRLALGQQVNEVFAHEATVGSSIHCQTAVLTIQRVSMDHTGEYTFLVRSPSGVSEGTVFLNVTLASGSAPAYYSLHVYISTFFAILFVLW